MIIKKFEHKDRSAIFNMMRRFYDSPALIHHSSDEILNRDIDDCLDERNILVEGFTFWENDSIIGYTICSRNYTTEYGGICIWVEDLFFEEEYCNKGLSKEFFEFLEKTYPEAVRFKLEVETENQRAIKAYEKNGYKDFGYILMTKEMI